MKQRRTGKAKKKSTQGEKKAEQRGAEKDRKAKKGRESRNNGKNEKKDQRQQKQNVSIARVRVTIPGAVDEKSYEKLQMTVTMREGTEETSEAMDKFKLKMLLKVTKGMRLEEIVKKVGRFGILPGYRTKWSVNQKNKEMNGVCIYWKREIVEQKEIKKKVILRPV